MRLAAVPVEGAVGADERPGDMTGTKIGEQIIIGQK